MVHSWKVGQSTKGTQKDKVVQTQTEGKGKNADETEPGSNELEHGRLRKRKKREVLEEEDDFSDDLLQGLQEKGSDVP